MRKLINAFLHACIAEDERPNSLFLILIKNTRVAEQGKWIGRGLERNFRSVCILLANNPNQLLAGE
ncbi:MAG: hypothetical protein OXI72_20895 [Gemmatimonadota bacterium]|nr:hypothetical protein [Gemmatimonadota bacterium]